MKAPPQRIEQVEQNSAEDKLSEEESFVNSPSELNEDWGVPQIDEQKDSNTSKGNSDFNNEAELSSLKGKVQLVDKKGEYLKNDFLYLKGLEINLILDDKKVATTFTDTKGEYSFNNLKLKTGEYKIVTNLTENNKFFFSGTTEKRLNQSL